MIIVEGPDGAGKTTLVNEICEHFRLGQGERGTTNRDDLWKVTKPDTYRAIHDAISQPNAVYGNITQVWDRLFWSEFVYWDLSNKARGCQFNDQDKRVIPHLIEAIAPPVIWCLPPELTVVRNTLNSRHQMKGVEENIKTIYHRYKDMERYVL